MVEGISELSEGVLLGERYQLVRRLEVFSVGAERVAGVEYEYWLATDVTSEADVWIQFAASDGVYAGGSALAGAVSALRRINHPAVPVVHAFGEYEFEADGAVTSVGYCAVPAAAGETLAAVLLREEIDSAEILAALAQVAEVLELLAEFELVHGHLSSHSVLLTATEGAGYEVVLSDLPASLALETALESELTVAADVYALAWLTVLALVGPAVLEAEFGAGFATAVELDSMAEQVLLRRREWAAENLIVLGVSEALAEVLLLALGEAAGRPRAAALTAALRAEWMLLTTGAEAAAVEAEAGAEIAAAAAAAAVAVEAEVVEEVVAEEIVAEEVGEEVVAEEVVAEAAGKKRKKSGAAKGAAVAAVAGAVVAAEIVEAGSAQAAQGAAAAGAGTAAASGAAAGAGGSAASGGAAAAGGGSAAAGGGGAAASGGASGGGSAAASGGAAAAGGSAAAAGGAAAGGAAVVGESTEVIPRVPRGPRPKSGAGAGAGAGAAGAASFSGGIAAGGSASGGHHAHPRKPKTGVLIGAGVGLVVVIALVITISTSGSNRANTASSGSIGSHSSASASASVSASAGATSGSGSSASASASSGSGSTAGTSVSTAATAPAGSETFPSTLTTVPASPGQAVQQVQTIVNQAKGELTSTEQGQLTQIISTLQQEISGGQSLSTGMSQFWALLHSNELPSSLNTYLIQYAEYLSASQGS
ncbi:MAG TPA: hypothetical protein VL551_15730 [Actinospica sp.]|nr:hypothetical protein [Actinospica sp.]